MAREQSTSKSVDGSATAAPRGRGRRRAAGAFALALLLGATAVAPAQAATGSRAALLVDAQGPSTYGGSGGGWGGYGYGGSGASPYAGSGYGASTVSSQAASAAQSTGVVLIDTVLPYQNGRGAGTGMVLTSSGQVLTNYHVVEGASTITVTVATTGKSYQASVVGSDETNDVALLQLTGASGLSTVTIDDEQVAVGNSVTAVGNAEGAGTLTAASGSVSSLTASVTTQAEGSVSSETLSNMIETTSDVVSGDSGGPLLDAEGEVVGIDTAASTGRQIDGYAIPIQRALAVVAQIRSGTETSTVRIGSAAFLGVELGSSGARQQSGYGYGYGSSQAVSGATVSGVVDGSAAQSAGLAAGDVITAVDGHSIGSASDLTAAMADANPGDTVTITWTDQSGQQHTAKVTLGSSPVA
ncbi:MAG: S1C family serine protease [Dermatophilaceae bacterium]